MGKKKRKENGTRYSYQAALVVPGSEGNRQGDDDNSTSKKNNECRQFSQVHSTWFPQVKWVSRHNQSHQTSTDQKLGENSSTSPANIHTKKNATQTKGTEPAPPSTVSKPSPAHTCSALVSELNEVKGKLMPTAKFCAEAVNRYHCENVTSPEYEFRRARSICNPYESLGETFSKNRCQRHAKQSRKRERCRQSTPGLSQFVNRAAIKLANVDALLGYCLTTAQKPQNSTKREDEPYVFVDLCGAPGGFSEYILYRHAQPAFLADQDRGRRNSHNRDFERGTSGIKSCFGFGMSLRGSNDDGRGTPWDLDHLKHHHLPTEQAQNPRKGCSNKKLSYRVCHGADNSGSIYVWNNVLNLQREISTTVLGAGGNCHSPHASLVVADGGFDAQRDSNNQEGLAHRIIVSQTAAALTLLRPGGIFVLKMFGFREKGTRRVLHFLYSRFDKITFVKPIVSRPASAERYLVCHGYAGCEKGWDGLRWRERMMLNPEEQKDSAQSNGLLEELMDSFGLQMLQLNIDTCNSIIEYLRNKSAGQAVDCTSLYQKPNRCLDLNMYEEAWQLFSRCNSFGINQELSILDGHTKEIK